jgi:uncharacterized membrane protein YqjE
MSLHAARSNGLLSAAGEAVDSLLETVQTRVRLFGIELQEEKFRLIQLSAWVAASVFCAVMAMTFVSVTVVYVFWESARLQALIGLTVFYVLCLGVILWQFRRYLSRQPKPFDATLGEIEKDRTCIHPTN